jgi:hypothetical protein
MELLKQLGMTYWPYIVAFVVILGIVGLVLHARNNRNNY